MSRSILEPMAKDRGKLFTVPLTTDELIGIHAAADVLGSRNATGMVYIFIRQRIDEAKSKDLKAFERKFKEEQARVLARSDQKKSERKRGARRVDKPVNGKSSSEKGKAAG